MEATNNAVNKGSKNWGLLLLEKVVITSEGGDTSRKMPASWQKVTICALEQHVCFGVGCLRGTVMPWVFHQEGFSAVQRCAVQRLPAETKQGMVEFIARRHR